MPDLLHGRSRAGPVRQERPVYVDLLPPCNAGCPPGENIQAWLAHAETGDHERAWRQLTADNPMPAIHGRVCYHPCESVCNRASLDSAVSIHSVERFLGDLALERGWSFDPPPVRSGRRVLVIGAGPSGLSAAYHLARLGHEVLRREAEQNARLAEAGTEVFGEALSYFPAGAEAEAAQDGTADEPSPRRYLSLLKRAAAAVDIPVIGSINGTTPGGWTSYARAMQDAGAAAIELNIYYIPGDPHITGREVEQRHIDILCRVKDAVTVPVAVKLSPHFSSPGEMALRLDEAGADGLVLFNRFLQPDIDPETLAVLPGVYLSSPPEARLPRTWISILRRHLSASLAATTGVEGPADVIKYLLAGADVVMTASALIRHGPGHAAVLLDGLSGWMARKGYPSVAAVRGMLALPAGADQPAYERAGYVRAMRAANSSRGPW